MRSPYVFLASFWLMLLLTPADALAQGTGSLTGLVRDRAT